MTGRRFSASLNSDDVFLLITPTKQLVLESQVMISMHPAPFPGGSGKELEGGGQGGTVVQCRWQGCAATCAIPLHSLAKR